MEFNIDVFFNGFFDEQIEYIPKDKKENDEEIYIRGIVQPMEPDKAEQTIKVTVRKADLDLAEYNDKLLINDIEYMITGIKYFPQGCLTLFAKYNSKKGK